MNLRREGGQLSPDYPLLTDFLINQAFCLLTLDVQYQPLEREAPQGGLKILPVKRIREANHPIRDYQSVVCESSVLTLEKVQLVSFQFDNVTRRFSSHLKL
jgi:hypothetical protein